MGTKRRVLMDDDDEVKIVHTKPKNRLEDYSVLLYGPPKIGKSTLASEWPKAIFLATETKGLKAMAVHAIKISNWSQFRAAISMAISSGKYETAIVDTLDVAFQYCSDYCCKKFGFEHPSDEEWGKGWDILSKEWWKEIIRLYNSKLTCIFVSHSKTVEIRSRFGTTSKTEMTLPYTGRRVLIPLVDIIMCMKPKTVVKGHGHTTEKRVVICRPTESVEAGDRTDRLPAEITVPKGGGFRKISAVFKEGEGRKD
jgi:hypothetical protein